MLGRSVVAGVLALLGADMALAAPPPGAPKVGVTRGAEHRAHPGEQREWWRLRALAPHDRGKLEIELLRQDGRASLHVDLFGPAGRNLVYGDQPLDAITATATRLDATGPAAAVHVRRRARRVTANVTLGGVSGRIALTHLRRGPAARGFDLGRHRAGDPGIRGRPLDLAWTVPAARAKATARLTRDGQTLLAPRGWRATYEHGWGDLALSDDEWQHWDEYLVHRGRTTWLLFGLNRADTITGPGARDAMWLGALARLTPRGLRSCRARVHRPRWTSSFPGPWLPWPLTVRARCGPLRAVFRERHGVGSDYTSYFIATARATVNGGGRGLARHAGH